MFFSRDPLDSLAAAPLFGVDAFIVAAPKMLDRRLPRVGDLASYPLLDLTDPGGRAECINGQSVD